MFSLPISFGTTANARNQARQANAYDRIASAERSLELALAEISNLRARLETEEYSGEADQGDVYHRAEGYGRVVAEVNRLVARTNDILLEGALIAASHEVTK